MAITWSELRDARRALNLTQQELADRLGVHVRTIRNWERENSSVPSKDEYRVHPVLLAADNAIEEAEERDGWRGWMKGALRVRKWTWGDLAERLSGYIDGERTADILSGAVPTDAEVTAIAAVLGVERDGVARISGNLRDLTAYSDQELLLELLRRAEDYGTPPAPSYIPAPPGTPGVPWVEGLSVKPSNLRQLRPRDVGSEAQDELYDAARPTDPEPTDEQPSYDDPA